MDFQNFIRTIHEKKTFLHRIDCTFVLLCLCLGYHWVEFSGNETLVSDSRGIHRKLQQLQWSIRNGHSEGWVDLSEGLMVSGVDFASVFLGWFSVSTENSWLVFGFVLFTSNFQFSPVPLELYRFVSWEKAIGRVVQLSFFFSSAWRLFYIFCMFKFFSTFTLLFICWEPFVEICMVFLRVIDPCRRGE